VQHAFIEESALIACRYLIEIAPMIGSEKRPSLHMNSGDRI
jgi:hypothetical protein